MQNKKLSIHLSSDIHLEFTDVAPDCPVADVGVFAGDIGLVDDLAVLGDFFVEMKKRYEHIIWVLGNHEFYHMDYEEALSDAKSMADKLGIHLMDIEFGTENLEIDGVKFWGSTLWMDFNNDDWFAKRAVGNGLNDFRAIKLGDRRFNVTECYAINKRTREAINWDADVIITHHAPIVIPHPQFEFTDISWGFYNSGLEKQIIESDVKIWMYGHTHHSTDFDLAGTRIIANCHGFKSRYSMSEGSGYNPDLIIEI